MSMLGLMEEKNIFSFEKEDNGDFTFIEECDRCYRLRLTPDQVRQLAWELLESTGLRIVPAEGPL